MIKRRVLFFTLQLSMICALWGCGGNSEQTMNEQKSATEIISSEQEESCEVPEAVTDTEKDDEKRVAQQYPTTYQSPHPRAF